MTSPRKHAMTPVAWVFLVLGLIAMFGSIVWLGALDDNDGQPLIENPGAVLIAAFGLVSAVLSLVLPQVVQIKRHVENGHRDAEGKPLALRDDLDGKHVELLRDIQELTRIALTTQRDVAWLMRQQAETDRRLGDVEDTIEQKE